MSIDYKNDITKYLTAEKFNDWGKKGDSRYKEILKTLNVLTYENISEVFEGDNHILKFLWYKLLVCKNMPAYQSDCDKAFFGKLNLPSFVPSELVNDWQRKKQIGVQIQQTHMRNYLNDFSIFICQIYFQEKRVMIETILD